VGTIPASGVPAEQLARLLSDLSSRAAGVLAANFLTGSIDLDAVRAAASRVGIVDFFWSDPDPVLVSWQVGSVAEAQAAADAGCDVIVVQGIEAGGHVRGHSALLPLLSAVLEVTDVPVLAAGGIGDGRALAAVLAAGADGARIGTRFIATAESGAHPEYKSAVLAARAGASEITSAFAECTLCATSPRARVLRSCIGALAAFPGAIVGAVQQAGRAVALPRGSGRTPGESFTGCVAAMPMYASDAIESVVTIESAGNVVTTLSADADRRLARLT
jgi:nitronate monooxygenase